MIISDKVVSISEFRRNTKKYLEKLKKNKGPLFLFQNNKPIWVFLDIEEYERLIRSIEDKKVELIPINYEDLPEQAKKKYDELFWNWRVDFSKLKSWKDVFKEI